MERCAISSSCGTCDFCGCHFRSERDAFAHCCAAMQEYEDDPGCTHCNGEGLCWDGADPLGDCPDEMHRCHACNGSGHRKDQVIF